MVDDKTQEIENLYAEADRYALLARAAERGDDALADELRARMNAIFDRIETALS